MVKERKIGGATVLTTAKGFTIYWFAADTMMKSNCNGSCIKYWPPVKGPATAGPGVSGKLGTIKRSDGTLQATFNGHPLYTYVGDSAPGQNKGNGLNISGGLWHEVTLSGVSLLWHAGTYLGYAAGRSGQRAEPQRRGTPNGPSHRTDHPHPTGRDRRRASAATGVV
jgi:predicted lipoprotein with Yx(FWY)xxD motif